MAASADSPDRPGPQSPADQHGGSSLKRGVAVGLGVGYSYERIGSIWVPIGLHGLYNSLIVRSAWVLVELGVVTL